MQRPFYEFIKAKCQNALKVSSICSIFGRTMFDSRASAELAALFIILLENGRYIRHFSNAF